MCTTNTEPDTKSPLFIVGMPRSGTTLLRRLLNQHSKIRLSPVETQFLPHTIQSLGTQPRFTEANLERLMDLMERSTFFENIRFHETTSYDRDEFLSRLNPQDWTTFLHGLLAAFGLPLSDATIWGDKTPAYLKHIPRLKRAFPTATFVHILRDPRDVCLSHRNTWGRSIFRAAADWRRFVAEARNVGCSLPTNAYYEVTYEDLVEHPQDALSSLCDFLDISFEPSMTVLGQPTRQGSPSGDAQYIAVSDTEIIASNTHKFTGQIEAQTLTRLEQVLLPTMAESGYDPLYATSAQPLSPFIYLILRTYDSLAKLLFYVKNKGIVAGLRYQWRMLTTRI